MIQEKKFFTTKKMVIIALFAAICYVALYFKIPIPSPVGNPFLHFGNMLVILAALLFGGWVGGLAGSIGMGLFDIFNGYADSCWKTFILKLGIGLIVGLIFAIYNKNKEKAKSPVIWLYITAAFFIIVGIVTAIISAKTGGVINFAGIEKPMTFPWVLYVFSLILGIILLITAIFSMKLGVMLQYALLASVCGIIFNLCGEFIFGVITKVMLGSGFTPALIASSISLPATLINGTFSIIIAVILFVPLKKAIGNKM